uniref:Uncharacterized protein n=1 Tax=Heterorhabditis bacteriophora TaxID=37862 RepID=A0A1I7WHV0_HETBA
MTFLIRYIVHFGSANYFYF